MYTGLLVFLLVVILLLAIPLEVDFKVGWPERTRNQIGLVWALGLVRARIPISSLEKVSTADEETIAPQKRDRSKSPDVLTAVRQRPFRQRLYRFIGDLWRSIIKENINICARIGLGDPSDTGQLWAVVGPLSAILAGMKEVSIVIEPDFVDSTFEFESSGRLRFVPLRVVAISLGLLVSPAVWRGLRSMKVS